MDRFMGGRDANLHRSGSPAWILAPRVVGSGLLATGCMAVVAAPAAADAGSRTVVLTTAEAIIRTPADRAFVTIVPQWATFFITADGKVFKKIADSIDKGLEGLVFPKCAEDLLARQYAR